MPYIKNGIKILASIHDAILIECEENETDEIILKAQKLMTGASSIVFGTGNYIETEAFVIKYPDRYSDSRGIWTWNKVLRIVKEIKAGNFDS